ncbi:MAG: hypothetical protein ABIP77_03050 [Candidatus Limnocylindrales bacterium]
MDDLPAFVTAIIAFAVVGVGIGMLVARRLDHRAAHVDEEPGGDDRPDA